MKHFQILWLHGVMGAVFSHFVAAGSGGWSIFRFCDFGKGGMIGVVFSDFVALGSGGWSVFRSYGFGE